MPGPARNCSCGARFIWAHEHAARTRSARGVKPPAVRGFIEGSFADRIPLSGMGRGCCFGRKVTSRGRCGLGEVRSNRHRPPWFFWLYRPCANYLFRGISYLGEPKEIFRVCFSSSLRKAGYGSCACDPTDYWVSCFKFLTMLVYPCDCGSVSPRGR